MEDEVEVRVVRLPPVRRDGTRPRLPAEWSDGRVWGTEIDAGDTETVHRLESTLGMRASRERARGGDARLAVRKAALEGGRRALVMWQTVRNGMAHPLMAEPGEVQPLGIVAAALTDPMDCPACGALVQVNNERGETLTAGQV